MIGSFKKCPRRYYLDYIEEQKPAIPSEALAIGSSYHANVEDILNGKPYDHTGITGKMAEAFEKYVDWRSWKAAPEQEFKVRLARGVYLKGKMDGITETGVPVEHKTTGTGASGIDKYIDHLAYDDQVALYMLVLGCERAIYTVIQKPTIRQKQNETEDEYLERVGQWYDTDPESKMKVLNVTRTAGELEEKRQEVIYLAKQIRRTKMFWRNPNACSIVSCPYASICLNYDPAIQPIGFIKKERKSEELCKF